MQADDKRFEFIDDDANTWYAKIDDDFKPDRKKFVEKRFTEKFGRTLDYEKITALVSRSQYLRSWYASVIEEYILEVDVPQYAKDLIEPEEFKEVSEKVSNLNKLNSSKSSELNKLAADYKVQVRKTENKYSEQIEKITKDPIVRILTLSSEELPLELQLRLENYTPSDESDPRTAALFGREMLIRYKVSLLEANKRGENIFDLIESNQTKF